MPNKPKKKHCFGKFQAMESNHHLILFGTIHLACEGDVLMTDEIRTAFNKSSDLMLEIDMSDPKVLIEMMSIVNSNDGIALSEKLGEDLSNKVDKLLQEKKSSNLAMYENINLQ